METNTTTSYITGLYPITVTKKKYVTSLDERGFKPVFEYEINGQPILWDRETRDVFLTGIWKALGYTKVDVIKTIQCNPNLKTQKLRGGLLKIQGTWVPYQDARSLCLRTAWVIRHQLTPLFGTDFVDDCFPPHHPCYRVVCLDYLQSIPNQFSQNPLLPNKRQYIIRSSQLTSPQCYSSPPSVYSPFSTSTSPPHSSSFSPMALSHILNNGEVDRRNDDHATTPDDAVVPDDCNLVGPDASQTLDFQVVPIYSSILDHLPHTPTLSPLASTRPHFNNIESPLFDDLNDTDIWHENDIQGSIETIQASILLQGLSHQDNGNIRQVVPSKVMVNGMEFSVLWN